MSSPQIPVTTSSTTTCSTTNPSDVARTTIRETTVGTPYPTIITPINQLQRVPTVQISQPVCVVVPMIGIKISTESMLFHKNTKFNSVNNTRLFLINDLAYDISEGTNVAIGQNIFCIVDGFRTSTEDLPPNHHGPTIITLPAGTGIIMNNDIPVAIAASINVTLPQSCSIKLLPGTKLQQRDTLVQFVLSSETNAHLVSNLFSKLF